MASQTHPLRPPPPCPTSNGSMGARGGQPAGSPETGDTCLKPPVGPKPRMLPKPAVPAKPCTPALSPGSRPPRLEFPSAEKINLLAGPKPYGGSSTALKRLSFGLKSPPGETSNGKGAPPPAVGAPLCTTEERSLAPVTLPDQGPLGVLKGTAPFKVKPVPVAAKRERFPGTTVEEILAKMECPCKEGSGSPDPAWGPRSIFSPDGSSRFGPKGYAAFRRQPSAEGGEGDAIAPRFEASWVSGPPEAQESRASCGDKPVAGRMKREGSPSPIGERPPEPSDGEAERHPGSASRESGSSPASASCNGDQSGRRKPPSPPGFSLARTCPIPVAPAELPFRVAPGNSAGLALAPGALYLPAEHPASALGSPAVPAELPALGSPPAHTELPTSVGPGFPGTPESLAKFPIGLVPAPDAPAELCHRISCSLGSLEAPGEGSQPPSGLPAGMAPGTPDAPAELPRSPPAGRALAPGIPAELPHRITQSPGAPKAPVPSPDTPNLCPKLPTRVSWSPGSPDGRTESPVSPYSSQSPERGSPSLSSDAEPFTGPAPADEDFQCPQLGLQRSSDGVVQLPDKELGMGVLRGSLAALPRGGPPHPGPPLEGPAGGALPRDLLGWSRKDLCSEFGIRGAHRAGEFGWAGETGMGKTEWPGSYRAGETEQDGEFGTGTRDWSGVYKETELLGDSNVGHGNWPDAYGIGDSCRQEGEFSPGKPDWSSQYDIGGADSSDGEFSTRKLDWTSTYVIGDNTQQDKRFSTSKPDWTPEYSVGDSARQDREFGTSRPDSTHEPGVGDIDQQDREFGIRKPDWTREHGVGDTDQQDRGFGTSKPDWTHEHGLSDTDHQDKEFGAGKPDWTHECSVKTSGQGTEWTREYEVGNTAQEDKPDWTRKFSDDAQQDRAFSPDKPAWLGEYDIHHTDQESAFGSGVGDPDSSAEEPGARKPGWSGTNWQESKFLFARRDCVSDFRIGGAEHESQYGVIGTERAGGFGLSALDPSGAIGTLGPAELGESQTDRAGHTRTVDLDEPREAGVGHSDWAQDLGLHGIGPSVGLGAISPEEPSRGWMDWTNELSVSSMDPSSSLGMEGFDTPREPGVGQPDGASDLGTGGPATARGFESVGPAEASARQTDWSHEFGCGDEGSAETREAGAGQMDWASEVRIGRGKQTNATAMTGLELHGDSSGPGSPQLSGPSPLLEEMLAKAVAQRKSPREERGLPPSPDAHPSPLPQEEDGGPRPEGDGAPSPSDATDRDWLPIEARKLSQPGRCGSQPSPPGEDFAFLEGMEVLDSTIYRSRANLGRKRGHRAPATRTAGTLALSEVEVADWMFQDSTEPRAMRWVSSDEEAAEEPQSRWTRPSLAAKGLKVPLFPGLNPSALKAKLRGRNRSAEEGAQLGEAKPTPPKEPHVQRSKSCKIPGLGGKPLVLPPKPEKSSGSAMAAASSPPRSDATSPHWLQALKLKKKKS
ncbi:182 kDa tankyrase-1-binding protein isoform X4 [Caretta caretta]|uniref:182 kDa tankyrase-1-binding protein isoform X4 n=1 Tax=Caretta caretta TaxID=8467 RepID=UPI003F4B794F